MSFHNFQTPFMTTMKFTLWPWVSHCLHQLGLGSHIRLFNKGAFRQPSRLVERWFEPAHIFVLPCWVPSHSSSVWPSHLYFPPLHKQYPVFRSTYSRSTPLCKYVYIQYCTTVSRSGRDLKKLKVKEYILVPSTYSTRWSTIYEAGSSSTKFVRRFN